MSTEQSRPSEQQAAAQPQEVDLFDQCLAATRDSTPDRAKELLSTIVESAMQGQLKFDRTVTASIRRAIAMLDEKISRQLAAVMHSEEFSKLEGSWRGLHHLVQSSETGKSLKIRVLHITKKELHKDLSEAIEFDQSHTFKHLYEEEFGTPGGEPYGALVGDFEFDKSAFDVTILRGMASVAAASFCPFIASASAKMFGMDSLTELPDPRDLEKIFEQKSYVPWNSFRESEDSRFVVLTMPRVLGRLPYGTGVSETPVDEFTFQEIPHNAEGKQLPGQHTDYCWMNASYVLGTRLTNAFSRTGFCTAIRGVKNGGKVEGLPIHTFITEDGDEDMKCPTEINITDRREYELSKLGFLPLCHFKNEDYAVFIGGQTTQRVQKYADPDSQANAHIAARLPYIMATSRFAHYLKVIGRDAIGDFMEAADCQQWLNNWISQYVTASNNPSREERQKYPLAEAKVVVREDPTNPGAYDAQVLMRPWLQMEQLTAALSMVARIPKVGG